MGPKAAIPSSPVTRCSTLSRIRRIAHASRPALAPVEDCICRGDPRIAAFDAAEYTALAMVVVRVLEESTLKMLNSVNFGWENVQILVQLGILPF